MCDIAGYLIPHPERVDERSSALARMGQSTLAIGAMARRVRTERARCRAHIANEFSLAKMRIQFEALYQELSTDQD